VTVVGDQVLQPGPGAGRVGEPDDAGLGTVAGQRERLGEDGGQVAGRVAELVLHLQT
jgi:hypothetical protein